MNNKRVAVVTGAGRGIGKAIAIELACDGYQVIIAEQADYGKQTAMEIQSGSYTALFVPVDVTSFESVQTMTQQVIKQFERIDILINNAGIRPTTAFLDLTTFEWNRVLAVNLTGTFNCCSVIAPWMVQQKWGRITNISSLAAQQGSTSGHSHYAAAKAGIIGLTKSLARELAVYQITVNCITPGWIDTEGWDGQLENRRDEFASHVPLKRLGKPEDVAYAVSFLASDRASYLTGLTLPVNGGLYIT